MCHLQRICLIHPRFRRARERCECSISELAVKWGPRSRRHLKFPPPKPPPLVGLGTLPSQAGAQPHWGHPGSQEHTCHCAGAQPTGYSGPPVRAATPGYELRALQWGRNRTTQTLPLNAKKKKSTFPRPLLAHSASAQPRDARPATDLSVPPGARQRPLEPA